MGHALLENRHGLARVDCQFTLAPAACDLIRLPKLPGATTRSVGAEKPPTGPRRAIEADSSTTLWHDAGDSGVGMAGIVETTDREKRTLPGGLQAVRQPPGFGFASFFVACQAVDMSIFGPDSVTGCRESAIPA